MSTANHRRCCLSRHNRDRCVHFWRYNIVTTSLRTCTGNYKCAKFTNVTNTYVKKYRVLYMLITYVSFDSSRSCSNSHIHHSMPTLPPPMRSNQGSQKPYLKYAKAKQRHFKKFDSTYMYIQCHNMGLWNICSDLPRAIRSTGLILDPCFFYGTLNHIPLTQPSSLLSEQSITPSHRRLSSIHWLPSSHCKSHTTPLVHVVWSKRQSECDVNSQTTYT